jgi:hypothetical protein
MKSPGAKPIKWGGLGTLTMLVTNSVHLLRVMEQNISARWCTFTFSVTGKPITDSNGACELMDCSAMVFINEFSNLFNIFYCFVGGLLCSADTQPALKHECHSKKTLKNVLRKPHEEFQAFR